MSPTPITILVAACHAAPATSTPQDKANMILQMKQDKGKTIETIPDLNSSNAKLMIHHNQTK
jgi:hypothetical protein